jgi:hypothetical protein
VPIYLVSSSSQVYLKFISSYSTEDRGRGYTIDYKCVLPVTVSSESGTLYDSGGSSGQYRSNEHLLTHIECPIIGQGIELKFREFDVVCPGDAIRIFRGHRILWKITCGKFADGDIPPITVAGDAMVQFTSDNTGTGAGYTLDYTCAPIKSGAFLTE